MQFLEGMTLKALDPCIMEKSQLPSLTVGKEYVITEIMCPSLTERDFFSSR